MTSGDQHLIATLDELLPLYGDVSLGAPIKRQFSYPDQMHRSARLLAPIALGVLFVVSCGSAPTGTEAATETPVSSTTALAPPDTTAATAPETSQPEALEAAPIFTSYEFPAGLIDDQPTLVRGLIGVPEGSGPFPVAIIMHGAHPPCVDDFIPDTFSDEIVTETVEFLCGTEFPEYIRHDIGLGYIVEALNDVGVAAVAIDVKATYVWWGGEPFEFGVLAETATTHHNVLRQLNDGEDLGLDIGDVAGRLDLDDITLVGHSRSGGHLISLLEAEDVLGFAPTAGVMIQPDGVFVEGELPRVPLLLIRGECDEDVGPDAGLAELTSNTDSDAQFPIGDLFIPSAGHRMLNTGLTGSTCPGQGDRSVIASQAAQGIASFVASGGETIELVDGSGATFTPVGGPSTAETSAAPASYTSPATVPLVSSTVEVIPPLPDGADYSDALDEDF